MGGGFAPRFAFEAAFLILLAVGAVNTALVLRNKSGSLLAGPTEFSTFFSSIFTAGDRSVLPNVVYDDQSGRFYVGALEFNPNSGVASWDFAVSKTSTPASLGSSDWTVFAKITSVNEAVNGNATEFPEFPTIGWNKDAVFVSFNSINLSTATFDHNLILAISKASILAGGPLST